MTLLWECLWKTSAATCVVWLLTLLLRHRSAALRHTLWLCGLSTFLIVPLLLPLARRAPAVQIAVSIPAGLTALPIDLPITVTTVSRSRPHKSFRINQVLLWQLLLGIWTSGSLVIVIRRARAAFRMKRITSRSEPAPAWLSAGPGTTVRLSREVRAPLTWGVLRPLILLPTGAIHWTPERLRSIFEHEQEHIRRLDPLSHWLAELVFAAWWFNPLVWLARSRAAHERECACDDAVLRSGVRPSDYASELLNLASTLPNKGEPVMALSALSQFERRIKNLLLPGIDRRAANSRSRLAVALATLVVVVPLTFLHAQAPVGQGDLSGTVSDPSGAVIPNATIIASGSTGNREVTRSNAAGEWSLSGIPAGNYVVEVKVPGFAIGNRSVTVAPGQRATLDHAVNLGSIQETIEVVGLGQPRPALVQSAGSAQRLRVGGNVQMTKLIRQIKPDYPESAKAQGIEGTVLMKAIISKEGNLIALSVMNKLADPDLAAAALDAVKQWRYQPTLLNGEPVEVITTVTMNFKLQ